MLINLAKRAGIGGRKRLISLQCSVVFLFSICGTLHSVDQFLNIKMTDISVTDPDKYPHMVCIHLASAFRVHITS